MTGKSTLPKKILISCAGLGMGNASRIAAIVEALLEQSNISETKIVLKVISWGAGYAFLREFKKENGLDFELKQLESYSQAQSIIKFLKKYVNNTKLLKKEIYAFEPNVLILDSDYHLPSYWRIRCPKVFIGQALDVVERARKSHYQYQNITEKFNMFFREKMDSLYQVFFSDFLIVPSFNPSISKNSRIKKISLIVRKEFLSKREKRSNGKKIAILLSGSEIEKNAFMEIGYMFNVKIFTPNSLGNSFLCHSSALDEFDIVFTQGGLSSISEVLSRGIFAVVFPIKNHPEQVLNALEVERLGLGIRATLDDLKDFQYFSDKLFLNKLNAQSQVIKFSGAKEAAAFIFHLFNIFSEVKTNH